MLLRLRYESLWLFTQRNTGRDTTVTRHRDDYQEAPVKFREAAEDSQRRGGDPKHSLRKIAFVNEVLTRSSSSSMCSNVEKSQYTDMSAGKLVAYSQQSDSRQNWCSSLFSCCWWHRWQNWHSSESFVEGISLERNSDSTQATECKQCTVLHAHLSATFFSHLSFESRVNF